MNTETTPAPVETVKAVSYENADGTLYGYANHKDWKGNPGAVPVRFMRERDYKAMRSTLAAAQDEAASYRAEWELALRQRDQAQSTLTAAEKRVAVANKLWALCVSEGWPWAAGEVQDTLEEMGLLYSKDMTAEDSGELCDNCAGDCETCYRAVNELEDLK